jgi:hypothetical protein
MKATTVIFNLFLFLFSIFLVLSEGPSRGTGYKILTVLLLLVPLLTTAVIFLNQPGGLFQIKKGTITEQGEVNSPFPISLIMDITVIICNMALLGFAIWVLISQYPHPKESGVNLFTVLVLLTPVLTLIFITSNAARKGLFSLFKTKQNLPV